MAELRHEGILIEVFETEQDAHDYLGTRARRDSQHAADKWTVEADRPIRVFCGGNLIETCHTHDEAAAFIAARQQREKDEPHPFAHVPHVARVYTMDPPPPEPAA